MNYFLSPVQALMFLLFIYLFIFCFTISLPYLFCQSTYQARVNFVWVQVMKYGHTLYPVSLFIISWVEKGLIALAFVFLCLSSTSTDNDVFG